MLKTKQKTLFLIIGIVGILFFALPFFVLATTLSRTFFIAENFDLYQRNEVSAILVQTTLSLHFYIDQGWWNLRSIEEQKIIRDVLNTLNQEFRNNIYPRLTAVFGFEARPGIDRDERITILIHPMPGEIGGYFSLSDGLPRIQAPRSNEREMVYLNADHIRSKIMRDILAHEFMHLITFNQKNIIRRMSEEIWLNDVRAEFASTLLGYNDVFRHSNLDRRMRVVLNNPNDSLTEWQDRIADYGIVNLFAHYLVDHYGIRILVDSLHSNKVGIASINYALEKNGFRTNFSQIFNNFKITLLINDCTIGEKFCFLHPHLRDFRITPRLNFLPFIGESVLQLVDRTTYWAGNWHKITGGKRVLTLEFEGDNRVGFRVPYLLCPRQGNCSINFLELDRNQRGKIIITGFNEKYVSLIIMPSIQSKLFGFNGREESYLFNWRVSSVEKTAAEKEAELKQQLLAQIEFLKTEIARLEAEIEAILKARISCQRIETNLFLGMRNSAQVRCLQEFLIAQGPEIYPRSVVTGNFFSSTRSAVIRFQEKHRIEILTPLGLKNGTGFVGPATRAKINQMMR
jgi:peptidoglycan hydrolase-like protein with peptidoglycan-binding domain